MVDHKILLNWLENHFGIKGMSLQWIESYLTNQSQRVVVGDINTTRCQVGQCFRANLVYSLHVSAWSNMCHSGSVPSLCR